MILHAKTEILTDKGWTNLIGLFNSRRKIAVYKSGKIEYEYPKIQYIPKAQFIGLQYDSGTVLADADTLVTTEKGYQDIHCIKKHDKALHVSIADERVQERYERPIKMWISGNDSGFKIENSDVVADGGVILK